VGFSALLKTKPVGRSPHCLLHYLPSAEPLQFGVLVPKRFIKKAAHRNTLKRIFREACRHKASECPTGQLLIRLNRPCSVVRPQDRAQWWNEVRQLLNALSSA